MKNITFEISVQDNDTFFRSERYRYGVVTFKVDYDENLPFDDDTIYKILKLKCLHSAIAECVVNSQTNIPLKLYNSNYFVNRVKLHYPNIEIFVDEKGNFIDKNGNILSGEDINKLCDEMEEMIRNVKK